MTHRSKAYAEELERFRTRCADHLKRNYGFGTTDFNILEDGLVDTESAFKSSESVESFCKRYAKKLNDLWNMMR